MLLFGALIASARSTAAQSSALPSGVINLPPYVVKDQDSAPPMEKGWSYAELTDFEVLSRTTHASTQKVLRDLRILGQALEYAMPSLDAYPRTRIVLVVCNTEAEYEALVPETVTSGRPGALMYPLDEVAGGLGNGGTSHEETERFDVISKCTPMEGHGLTYIVCSFPEGTLRFDDQLCRAYVLARLAGARPRLPAFFEEGLAELAAEIVIHKDEIKVGVFSELPEAIPGPMNPIPHIGSPSTSASKRAQSAAAGGLKGRQPFDSSNSTPPMMITKETNRRLLGSNPIMPLAKVVAVEHDDPLTFQPRGLWALESEAFVHMCLYGTGRYAYGPAFGKYLAALVGTPANAESVVDPVATLAAAFDQKPTELDETLRAYVEDGSSQSTLLRPRKGSGGEMYKDPAPVEFRAAADGEIARIKGDADFLAAGIDTHLNMKGAAAKHALAAESEFAASYRRGERSPRFLAAWGLFEYRSGQDLAFARRLLEAAIAAGSTSRPASMTLDQLRGVAGTKQ